MSTRFNMWGPFIDDVFLHVPTYLWHRCTYNVKSRCISWVSRGCSHRRKRRVASNHLMGWIFTKKKTKHGEVQLIEELLGLPFLQILQEAWNLNSKWKVHLALLKISKQKNLPYFIVKFNGREPEFPAKILFTLWNVKPTTQTRQLSWLRFNHEIRPRICHDLPKLSSLWIAQVACINTPILRRSPRPGTK